MRIRSLSLLFICFSLAAIAQKRPLELHGAIKTEGAPVTYELTLYDSANFLSGIAIEDKNGPNEMVLHIKGKRNPTLRTVFFWEDSVISRKNASETGLYTGIFDYEEDEQTIYYRGVFTNANNLRMQVVLQGKKPVQDAPPPPKPAPRRGIVVQQEVPPPVDTVKKIAAAPKPAPAPIVKPAPNPRPSKPIAIYTPPPAAAPVTPLPPSKPSVITAGTDAVYNWKTDSVKIEIWDGGSVDRDFVSVIYNGATVLGNYMLIKDKKELKLYVPYGQTSIINIKAENEGNEPPNTADILIYDGPKSYTIKAYNKEKQEAVIKLVR